MIHHQCRGDKLSNPVDYYKTVKKRDLATKFREKRKRKTSCCYCSE